MENETGTNKKSTLKNVLINNKKKELLLGVETLIFFFTDNWRKKSCWIEDKKLKTRKKIKERNYGERKCKITKENNSSRKETSSDKEVKNSYDFIIEVWYGDQSWFVAFVPGGRKLTMMKWISRGEQYAKQTKNRKNRVGKRKRETPQNNPCSLFMIITEPSKRICKPKYPTRESEKKIGYIWTGRSAESNHLCLLLFIYLVFTSLWTFFPFTLRNGSVEKHRTGGQAGCGLLS